MSQTPIQIWVKREPDGYYRVCSVLWDTGKREDVTWDKVEWRVIKRVEDQGVKIEVVH